MIKVPGAADAKVGFETIPAGRYPVVIYLVEQRGSKADIARKYLHCEAKVRGGEFDGKALFWNLPLGKVGEATTPGAGITRGCVEAAGVEWTADASGAGMFDEEELKGALLDVEVDVGEYNGKPTNNVTGYLPTSE